MNKPGVLIIGKLPPPYFGPAIATEIIINSSLKSNFKLQHFDSSINNKTSSIGSFSITKPWKIFSLYIAFYKQVKKQRPSLVIIPISQSKTGFIKDSVFLLIACHQNSKTLLHLRGSSLREILDHAGVLFQKYGYWVIRKSEGVIVLGNKLKYIFHGIVPDDKIFVVPNGANLTFPSRASGLFQKVKILYLSNLQSSKGIVEVVEAVKILNEKSLKFSLSVYGSWRDKKTKQICENIVSLNKLPVEFCLPIHGDLKTRAYSEADVFIFPPNAPEGHPWVIVEAMAAGLPIITTDQGAITESVIDGENGFIVPIKNPTAISDKLEILIENITLREQMGRRSHELYEQNLTEEKMVERLQHVLKKVLEE